MLLDLGGAGPATAADGALDITGWADRVDLVHADGPSAWVLPALGPVAAPDAVLVRPDGHVAWVGVGSDDDRDGLRGALMTWFGASRIDPGEQAR